MLKVGLSRAILVAESDRDRFVATARTRNLQSPCIPSGSELADAIAALLLDQHVGPSARFPLDRCRSEELDDEAHRRSAMYQWEPDGRRLVVVDFAVQVRPDEEAGIRELARTRYGVPIGTTNSLLASTVDDEVDATFEGDGWVDLPYEVPDYAFWIED